ncbi:helix-turn-helix domain-containing protein [Salinactinospora qingdaonensis]|uniref:Helix-turn-helix transcriptional regulator n=1 Tax=Salinactinospora qingdaonensis TaxID=702744 RepID=A0ABP7GGR7_9ACTN
MARHLPAESNPALRRFGVELSRLRKLAEKSQQKLAKETLVSQQQVGAIERAERYPSKDFAALADQALNSGTTLSDMWPELYKDAYPHGVGEYVDMERQASMIRQYHPTLIPGLVQTEDYARTTLRAGNPLASSEEIERLLEARMSRQRLFSRPKPPLAWFVVDEAVITRPVGSAKIMSDQLGVLLDMIDNRKIQFQVIPFATCHHPGLTGPFIVLSFQTKPDLVYAETVAQGEMVSDPDRVAPLTLLATNLQGAALSPEQSRQFIYKTRETFNGPELA